MQPIFRYLGYLLLVLIVWQVGYLGVGAKIIAICLALVLVAIGLISLRLKVVTIPFCVCLLLIAIGTLGYQKSVSFNAFIVDLLPFLLMLTCFVAVSGSKHGGVKVRSPSYRMLVAVFIVLCVSILTSVLFLGVPFFKAGRLTGPLGPPVNAIYTLVLLLPLFAKQTYKFQWWEAFVIVFMIALIASTSTRMPLAALLVAILVVAGLRWQSLPKGIVLGVIASVALVVAGTIAWRMTTYGMEFDLSARFLSGRNMIWEISLRDFWAYPVFGQGFGSAYQNLLDAKMFGGLQPHNEIVRILHNQGLVGLVGSLGLFIWFVASLVKTFLWRLKSGLDTANCVTALGLWAAFSVLSLTDNVLIYPLFMIVMCWYTVSALTEGGDHSINNNAEEKVYL